MILAVFSNITTISQWPDSSTGRALHQNLSVQGSNHHSGLNFSGRAHYCLSSTKNCEDNSHSVAEAVIAVTTGVPRRRSSKL